jgi:hypothetical protein
VAVLEAARRVAVLREAMGLADDPRLGKGPRPWSRTALAQARRVAEAALRDAQARGETGAQALARVAAAWAHLERAAFGRHRGLRDQLRELGPELSRRLGLGTPRPRVADPDELLYLLAYLERLWTEARSGPAPLKGPAAPPPAPPAPSPPSRPARRVVEEVVRLAESGVRERPRVRTADGQEVRCDRLPTWPVRPAGAELVAQLVYEGDRLVSACWLRWADGGR